MDNTFEKQADYIPYTTNEHNFYYTLQNLSTTSLDHWYADENGLKGVGTFTKVFQTVKGFFGWLGLINYTSVHNVEYGLMKFLYQGYSQGYMRKPVFKEWLTKLQTKLSGSSELTRKMLERLSGTDESMQKHLSEFLTAYHAKHHSAIDSIGGRTAIPKGLSLSFGDSPLNLGYRALKKGLPLDSLGYALAAYNLRVTAKYDSVGDLFLAIAHSSRKNPSSMLVEKLKEFQTKALDEGKYKRSLQFYEAIHRLNPGTSEESDPSVLIEYGRIKRSEGDYKRALYYFTRAEDRGGPPDELDFAKLYMKAANKAFMQENKNWFLKDFTQILHWYDKAINLYEKNNKFSEVLSTGPWLNHYLVVLKHQNELDRGIEKISRHVNRMIDEIKEDGNLPDERSARIQTMRPKINNALEILDLMIQHDPYNPEHHFRKGLLYDYLNQESESNNPLPSYQRALDLDLNNPHYLVSYRRTCTAGGYPEDKKYSEYYTNLYSEHWYKNERFDRNHSRFEAI